MEYADLLHLLVELEGSLKRLTAIQEEKRAKLQDLHGLNDCMKREQALSLSLRGMESKREKLLSALGLEGVPLRELPRRCPPEHRAETNRAVEQVLRQYEVLQSAQGAARAVLEGRLRQVEGVLRQRGVDPEEDQLPAVRRPKERGHTDLKV